MTGKRWTYLLCGVSVVAAGVGALIGWAGAIVEEALHKGWDEPDPFAGTASWVHPSE